MTLERVLLIVLSLTWSANALSFMVGKWVKGREASEDVPLYRITQLERRMDQAGQKMSDFTNEINGMAERFRVEFMTRRECEAIERLRTNGRRP